MLHIVDLQLVYVRSRHQTEVRQWDSHRVALIEIRDTTQSKTAVAKT